MESEPEEFAAVVVFEDKDTVEIVPCKKVKWTGQPPKEEEVVSVMWSNKKQYATTFIMKGDIKCYIVCVVCYVCVCVLSG